MAAFTSDEIKYMNAISDYRSKKISYSTFLDRTIPLKDVSRRIKDSHTMTGRKFTQPYKKKGGRIGMRGGGIVQKKLTYKVT
jgi:hypothetical protein|tara:strand:- start:186 stop:431 length:246 start_codon:yes stop_codon:yes gene_type:complete